MFEPKAGGMLALAITLGTMVVLWSANSAAQAPTPQETPPAEVETGTGAAADSTGDQGEGQRVSDNELTKYRLKWGFWSLGFTTFGLLIGIAMLFFIWKISIPGVTYGDFFAEGQFVQLVVIIVIAGNVCSLGIMGILEKGEISTIYAGIVGYILGKRSSKEKPDKEPETDLAAAGKGPPAKS